MPKIPCAKPTAQAGNINEDAAQDLVLRMHNWAKTRADEGKMPFTEALKQVAGEMRMDEENKGKIAERNSLLTIRAKREATSFISRFKTIGEGVRAFLEGGKKTMMGGRLSVDIQGKALHGKYLGALVDRLESDGTFSDFKRGHLQHEVWQEMGELGKVDGKPGVSGSEKAVKIAQAIDDVTKDMVSRQNRAGAYINNMPGYIVRQTHDMQAIRRAGGEGDTARTKSASYQAWSNFIMPLLDADKTFKGADPEKFLRNVHEGLYTGIHGEGIGEGQVLGFQGNDVARKSSQSRVLHFKDSEAAWKYNEQFGIRSLRDSVFSDLHYRARAIALMENLGPNPKAAFESLKRELGEAGRSMDDAAKQVDSLHDWKIDAAYNAVSGANDHPVNFTLARRMGVIRAVTAMAKMGAATITKSFADKAFLQSEMAYQGVRGLDTLGAQVTGMFKRSPENKHYLRMMGVAMDGLIGNTMSRYTQYNSMAGWSHNMQRKFFDLNGLNLWTDVHKATAAELMSAHLGEHADLPFEKLPGDLQRVLSLYEITGKRWDALRDTVQDHNGAKFITPEGRVSDEAIKSLLDEKSLTHSDANILRERDKLDSQLRSYFADRVDYAVPTPGAETKKWMTMDTRAGTPLGETVRALMMFKSFPITIMDKVLGRELYGRGSDSVKQWLLNDHKGKFAMVQLAAMLTASGYIANSIKDALKGRTPARIWDDEGVHPEILEHAMMRGGALGMLGDVAFNEYDRGYKNILEELSGPIIGQAAPVSDIFSQSKHGKFPQAEAGKLLLDNSPYINLFYIRPVLDYMFIWNLQEMLTPGTLQRMEHHVHAHNHQDFFLRPSEHVH